MPSFVNGSLAHNEGYPAEPGRGHTEPIAIIGMAMRAADEATDVEAFWDFLLRARQAARPIPEDRLSSKGFYHPDPNHGGTFYVKGAAFLEESPTAFDAAFFKMSKTEVQSLDPQQRLVMENVYHALENAGLPMENIISSNTSVFVSGFNYHHADRLNSDLELSFKHKPTGAENSMISGRVSWFYDFQGASLTIDTACSSSLVGLHLARQSLEAKESDMAIVSGVSVIGYLSHLMKMSYSGLLGSEGKSLAFDKRADGYGLGEGVGTVILKTLSAAIRDGDTIRAVVRGTGLNHDGHTPGMTYPSSAAQESLIRKTYMAAGLDPRETIYAESHGTGTQAGDLMECTAIAAAFETGKRDSPFYIGAVKPNVGHLEGGAGITSVIKSVLLLEAGIIPPNATLQDINPNIRPEWNVHFPTRCISWPTSGIRRASISSYGISGTNAHCILDDAYHYSNQRGIFIRHRTTEVIPSEKDVELIATRAVRRYQLNGKVNGNKTINDSHGLNGTNGLNGINGVNGTHLSLEKASTTFFQAPILFVLSAFDEKSLNKVAAQMRKYVSSLTSNSARQTLYNVAFTLSTKRTQLPWKTYAICNSVEQFDDKLSKLPLMAIKSQPRLRIGFVFTGQGAQYARMGQQLLIYAVFRQSLEAASLYFKSLGCDWSLLEELEKVSTVSKISRSAFAHPLSCAVQIALLDLLLSWNVVPHRVVGHSSGEIAAAYCAGKISREGAWRVAYFRGHVLLHGKTSRVGGMLAAGIEEEPLHQLLNQVHEKLPGGTLSIACYNSPQNHTISGDDAMVDALKALLDEQGIFTRKLKVEHAAHSAHMEQYTEEYEERVGDLPSNNLLHFDHTVQMFSTLTGCLLDDSCVPDKASHWSDSMVRPVEFTKALSLMCFDSPSLRNGCSAQALQVDVILEVGPHPVMQSAVKDILGSGSDIPYLATLSRKDTGLDTLLDTIGSLAIRGAPVCVEKVNSSANPSVKAEMVVNLPPYPFDHEEGVLYESRLIKNTRLRQFPRHDLFGAPVPDWNPNSPRWRHFLRVSENPWLKEHIIGNDFVFPGAGYMVMAVEGMKQITDHGELVGIFLRDVKFKSMLIIPDDTQGVEVCLSFYPVPESKTSLSTAWKRFEVASYNQETEEWIEHCTGEVSPDLKKSLNPIDGYRLENSEKTQWAAFAESRENACKVSIDFQPVYNHLREIGVNHGPAFRNLAKVSIGDQEQGLMTGDIIVPNVGGMMPKDYAHEHLIHPTTLDNVFHASFASIYDLESKVMMRRGCVPSYVQDIWLSTTALSSKAGTILRCTSEASHSLHGGFESTVRAWDPSNPSEKLMSLEGIRLSPFKPESSDAAAPGNGNCYSVEWHPDLSLLTETGFQKLLLQSSVPPETYDSQLKRFSELQLVSTLLAADVLHATRGLKVSSLDDHQRRYVEFLRSIAAGVATDNIPYVSFEMWLDYIRNPTVKEDLYREIEKRNSDGGLLIGLGSKIPSILKQDVTTQHLLLDQDNLFSAWEDSRLSRGDILPALTQYLTPLHKSRRSLRILDVGGGTGALAEHVLKTLGGDGRMDAIEQYVVASRSAIQNETLEKRLAAWADTIRFETIDLVAKAFEQETQAKTFDLVVTNHFVCGQPNVEETMMQLHSLMRPGGRLLMLEPESASLPADIIFGSLPGWQGATKASPDARRFTDNQELDNVLRKTGFSGIDFQAFSSIYPEFADLSVTASTATHRTLQATIPSSEVLVVIQSHSEVSRLLAARFLGAGVSHSFCQIDELRSDSVAGKVCISLLEAEQPILNATDSGTFEGIRNLVTTCDSLLWVTGDPLIQPEFQIATGLIRTIRWELDREGLNLVTFSLDSEPTASVDENVDALIRVLRYQFLDQWSRDFGDANAEYRTRDSVIETNHIVENAAASSVIGAHFSPQKPVQSPWEDIERPVRLISTSPGVDSLTWVTDEDISEKPLAANEIEIAVHAVGLNFKDLLVAMGEINQPGFGHEAAGIVVEVGSSVNTFKPGDRVMYLGDPSPGRMGTLRTRSRIHSGLAIKIPAAMNFEIAAGLPIIYGTVIYSLGHVARLSAGEKVLIHAAAGGIGQAAIQYAQAKRAEIFVTLSSPEKKQFIMDNFQICEDHIFSSRDLNFSKGIKRIAPAGVDVVLNSLSGEALRQSWACLAPFGRFVEIGKLDLQAGAKLDMTPFLHNISFSGVDLNALAENRPEVCQELLRETIQLWSDNNIHEACPTQVLAYGQLREGLRLLQTGKSIGKITLVPGVHPVSVIPAPLPSLRLDANASYILAGGLGGIGRSIALRLARRGAKHLVFLSRSAAVHEAGQETIAQLQLLGCTSHVFQCDISDHARLHRVITQIQDTLPPIQGCIQCCFVLKDRAFESMTHEEWQAALVPKVSGSWNLHCLLPDVDFFLLLSSITGIVGNRSQANYNAGNNFQDALARHRVAKGMHGVSVNLGAVVGVGFIAENAEYAEKHTFKMANPQTEEEVLATVEYLIDRRHHTTPTPDTAQLVCGLRTPISYSLGQEAQPTHLQYPMFAQLPPALPGTGNGGVESIGSAAAIHDLLQSATCPEEAARIIHKALRRKMADLLNISEDSIDDSLNVRANGVDSLIEMEFRTWFAKDLGAAVPAKDLAKDLTQLSARLVSLSSFTKFH